MEVGGDSGGIAITIPMLGRDLDIPNSIQRLNKTSPATHFGDQHFVLDPTLTKR